MPEPADGLSRHWRLGPRWDATNLHVEREARVPQIRAINRALCLMNPGMPCPAAPTISLGRARRTTEGEHVSSSGAQVDRHEVVALRFQSLSSIMLESRLYLVTRTCQTRVVVAPEALDAACCQRAFCLFLEIPARDQVLAAFVDFQNNRQHRRPSVHSRLLGSSTRPDMAQHLHPVPRRTRVSCYRGVEGGAPDEGASLSRRAACNSATRRRLARRRSRWTARLVFECVAIDPPHCARRTRHRPGARPVRSARVRAGRYVLVFASSSAHAVASPALGDLSPR